MHRGSVVIGFIIAFSGVQHAQGGAVVDPRGVFFHSYTGPSAAIEWIDFRALEGDRRYQFSDIRGIAPYLGEIDTEGRITWDNTGSTSGTGLFSDQNNATMTLQYFGGTYQSTLTRAPGTDAEFITQIESRAQGNAAYAGSWDLSISELDAATGALIATSSMSASISVIGDLIRLDYADGSYYQGVFETEDHAGFRVVLPAGGIADQFASFEGSETSLTQNLLGDLRFDGIDTFTGTFLTQTRRPPGRQDQFVYTITGSRSVPAPGGLGLLGAGCLILGRRRR